MNEALQQKLDGLTTQPGVYKHKDDDDSVLYVGKAKNLRNRVRSYFHEGRRRSGRIRALVGKIADVEVIVTDTEAEALILENNLIKELKPRYNVNLRDDKTYPYICIKNERFPRVFPTRDVRQDGSKYFGPYTDVKSMNLLLDTIRDIFYLRTCKLALTEEKIQAGDYDPCLEFHIDNCKAPCIARQSEEDYDRTIEQVEELLNGHTKELESLLEDEMQQKAEAQEYEAAADLRDRLKALRKYAEKQKIVSQDFEDRDVFALHTDEEADVACGVIFKVREGKMIGRQHKYMRPIEHRLEEELNDVRGDAESAQCQASQVAEALERVNSARADGGPGQKDIARNILRDLVVKRTYEGLNSGAKDNKTGKKADQKGSVKIAEVPKLTEAREGPDVAWTSAQRAAKGLDDTWSVLEYDEDAEPQVLRAKTSQNFPAALVDAVEKSLGRDDLANAVVGGGD